MKNDGFRDEGGDLMDKKAKLEQQILEEQVYAKLWMLDHDKKIQRERNEASTKQKKV